MQRDLDTKHLIEVVSSIGTHPYLDLRLVEGFIERELCISVLRICYIFREQRWLLEVHLLE